MAVVHHKRSLVGVLKASSIHLVPMQGLWSKLSGRAIAASLMTVALASGMILPPQNTWTVSAESFATPSAASIAPAGQLPATGNSLADMILSKLNRVNLKSTNPTQTVSLPTATSEAPPLRSSKRTEDNGVNFQMLQEAAGSAASPASSPLSDTGADAADTATSTLRGTVTTLKVIRGRSQIIKFAQPIIRISIADPALADVIPLAPDQVMINGLQRGVTSLIVWDENGQEGIFDLIVENDTTELVEAVKAIAPNEQIDARITDDSFILSGRVSSSVILDEIRRLAGAYGFRDENFVDLTETPVPQVILDVKIAEASRNSVRDLKTGFAHLSEHLGQTRADSISTTNSADPDAQVEVRPGLLPPGQFRDPGGVLGALVFRTSHVSFQVRWDFLETQGKITLLAEPRLVCTHGREAEFLAGGEFPYVTGVSQNGIPTIDFMEYGVKLRFTPWIAIRSKRIELRVEPEVSGLDFSNCINISGSNRVCGLLTRRTSTTVELEDGESLLISGILTREEQNSFAQVPFVGSIPILGQFFKNSNLNKNDKELIIVVTPRLVKPGNYGEILGGT